MTYLEFKKALDEGTLSGVYLFAGPEEFAKEEMLAAARSALLPVGLEALNEDVLEDASAAQIVDASEMLPVMSDKRLVVVRDYAGLVAGKGKAPDDDVERLLKWLENPPNSTVLIFYVRGEADERTKMSKGLKKTAQWVAFDLLSEELLTKRLIREAKGLGAKFEERAAMELVERAGRALTTLIAETRKLAAYAGAGGTIAVADVEKLVTPSAEHTVFQMIDALFAGNARQALRLEGELIESGQSRAGIIAMLIRQLRILTHTRRLLDAGATQGQIAKQLEVRDFVVRRSAQQARGLRAEKIEALYRAAIEEDFAFKSGRAREEEALDRLMIRIGNMKKGQ